MARRKHYHVYVIELSSNVLLKPRFIKSNPNYVAGKPCVYVGMTGLDPDVRFDKHKAGIQGNRYVQEFGLRLLPQTYALYNRSPMTKPGAWQWNWALICAKEGMEFCRLMCSRPGIAD